MAASEKNPYRNQFRHNPEIYLGTTENAKFIDRAEGKTETLKKAGHKEFHSSKQHNSSRELLEELKDQQHRVRRSEKGFVAELHETLAFAYEVAEELHDWKTLWTSFIGDPFWQQCKRKKPSALDSQSEILFWVLRYLFEATNTSGPRYQRVHKYASTLRRFLKEGVHADDVEKKLRARGVDYAFTLDADEADEGEQGSTPYSAIDEQQSTGGSKSAKKSVGQHRSGISAARGPALVRRGPRAMKPEVVLSIEVTAEQLEQVLANKSGSISFEHRGGWLAERGPDWQRVVATTVLTPK